MIFELVSRLVRAVLPSIHDAPSDHVRRRSVEVPPLDWIKNTAEVRGDLGAPRPPSPSRTPYLHEPNDDGPIETDGGGADMIAPWDRPGAPQPQMPE